MGTIDDITKSLKIIVPTIVLGFMITGCYNQSPEPKAAQKQSAQQNSLKTSQKTETSQTSKQIIDDCVRLLELEELH